MTLITMPPGLVQTVAWTLTQPGESSQSPWTGHGKDQDSGHHWYSARVTFVPLIGNVILLRRSFLAKAGKKGNTFRLDAVDGPDQSALTSVLVKGGGQTGYTLLTDGWGSAGTKLLEGHFITVNGQLIMLGADAVANGSGEVTLSLNNALRTAPADNAPVEVKRPYGTMKLIDPVVGWSVNPGAIYGAGFECREAY
jgi:hypothetical protein